MQTNYFFNVRIVLYCFIALVMKLLTVVDVVKAKIITVKLKDNFHLNMSLHIHSLTFVDDVISIIVYCMHPCA